MSDITTEQDSWYRHPWVWFLILLPFTAVIFGIVMIVSANYQPDDLVVDNYYKEGMGINRRLELDDKAAVVGASVKLDAITDEGAVFRVDKASEELTVAIFHVSDGSRDLEVNLVPTSDGIYLANSRALSELLRASGIWYIEVRDIKNKWRLRSRVITPLSTLELKAG